MTINIVFAQEMSDVEAEMQGQKDMLSFIQYTARYRFSPALKVGDKVVYKYSEESKKNASLDIFEKENNELHIVEFFDGNELHYIYNTNLKKLIDFWGFDEDKVEQSSALISETEAEETVKKMIQSNNLANKLELGSKTKSLQTEIGDFNCSRIEAKLSESQYSVEQIQSIKEQSTIYFSEKTPKLLPFAVSMFIIGNEPAYEAINGGCIKSNIIELIEYNKGEKK